MNQSLRSCNHPQSAFSSAIRRPARSAGALALALALVLPAAAAVYGAVAPNRARQPAAPAPRPAVSPRPAAGNDAAGSGQDRQQPTSILPGRPDAPGAGAADLLGEPFRSVGLGLTLRPTKGMVPVRRVGSSDVIEFIDERQGWVLKVSKTRTPEPVALMSWRDRQGVAHVGLLETTLREVAASIGKHEVLRKELLNIGARDVGVLAVRYNQGLQTWLTQQAIIQATPRPGADLAESTMYHLIALKTPVQAPKGGAGGADAAKAAAFSPDERAAAEAFRQVIDSVEFLDLSALRAEQEQRLFATRNLLVNIQPDVLRSALVPQQWLRIIRDGKDVGYTYVIEESAAGIPAPLNADDRKAGKARPDIEPGDGVLVGMRSWVLPADAAAEVESEQWMYVSPDLRHEDWSQLSVVRARQSQAGAGAAGADVKPAENADPVLDHRTEFGSSDRRRVRGGADEYTLNVTHVAKRENPKPVARMLPPMYLPRALGHILPRIVPRNRPKQYMFYSYVSERQELIARYIDVLPEARVNFRGELIRAVPVQDRLELEGSVTTHYVSPNGQYLGSENKEQKLLILPTDEKTLLELWKDAKLTDPEGIDRQGRPAAAAAADEGDDEAAPAPRGLRPAQRLPQRQLGATPRDVGTLGNSAAGGGTGRQVDRPTSAQRVPGPPGGARRSPQQTPGPNLREPRDPRDPREPGEVRDPGDRRDPRLR